MQPDGVKIIELSVDRWHEYRALRLAALRSDPLAFAGTYDEAAAYPAELWQDRLASPSSIMLFAECGGKVVGSATALLGVPGDAATAQIVGVFVARDYRRRGIARRLLVALLERLAARPEIGRVRLGVTATQTSAIALYGSLGFELVGRHEGKMCDGDRCYDELIMERAAF